MKVLAIITGGKDSVRAIELAKKGGHEVVGLISFLSKKDDDLLRQMVNFEWLNLIAEALEIPLHEYLVSGDDEFLLFEMKAALHSLNFHVPFEGVVFGAIKNSLHHEMINKLCEALKVKTITPLWGAFEFSEIKNLEIDGYEVIISGKFNEDLSSEYVGRDASECTEKLSNLYERYEVCLFGEHGDFQTFVTDGPIFKKKIALIGTKTFKREKSLLLKVDKAKLINK